jgi:hypothetical protein
MAATAGAHVGVKAKIYRNTGTYGSPTWVAMDLVKDVSVGMPWDMVDASVRGSRVKLYAPTQTDFSINMSMRIDYADTAYLAIRAASVSATAQDLLVLDGAVTEEGAQGFRADFHVSLTAQDQAIGNVLYDSFDLKPGVATNYPKAIVMGAASAITATTPG